MTRTAQLIAVSALSLAATQAQAGTFTLTFSGSSCSSNPLQPGCTGTIYDGFGSTGVEGVDDGTDNPLVRLLGDIRGEPVAALLSRNHKSVYLVDGDGIEFGTLAGLTHYPTAIVAADLDGDAYEDVVVADRKGYYHVFQNVTAGQNYASKRHYGGYWYDEGTELVASTESRRVYAAVPDANAVLEIGLGGKTDTLKAVGVTDVDIGDVDGSSGEDLVVVMDGGYAITDRSKLPYSVSASYDWLGLTSADLGDVDGDGVLEIAAARDGYVYIMNGFSWAYTYDAYGYAGFGSSVALADVDGDGFDDLAVGAPGEEAVLVVSVTDTRGGDMADEGLVVYGESKDFGESLSAADLDGDGLPELASDSSVFSLAPETKSSYSGWGY